MRLAFLKNEKPEIVYIGTGQYSDLPVTDEAKEILAKYETVIQPTPEVLESMAKEHRPYVAILHITC